MEKPADRFYWANKAHTRKRGQCIDCHLKIKAERWDNPDWVPACPRCGKPAPRTGKGGRRLCEVCHSATYDRTEVIARGSHRLHLQPCKGCGGPKQRGERLRYCATCSTLRQGLTKGMRRFNITVAEHRALLDQQNAVCAICKKPNPSGKMLAIDHDHSIPGGGRDSVRGLLCNVCNYQRLALFEDDPALLRAAADYLEMRPAQQVLNG